MKRLILFIIIAVAVISCNKKENPAYNNNEKSTLILEFDNVAGDKDLETGTTYHNASDEDLTVTTLQYVVTDIILTGTDNATYTIAQDSSIFVVDESDEESAEAHLYVPEGEYKSVQFTIRYLEIQGTSPAAPGDFNYAIGAPDGSGSSKTITLDLTQGGTAKVKTGRESEVHLLIDVLKFFTGFSIGTDKEIINGDFNALPASNIVTMIKHDHTHN